MISHAATLAFVPYLTISFDFSSHLLLCNHPGIIYEYLAYTEFYVSICGCRFHAFHESKHARSIRSARLPISFEPVFGKLM
jgi:hypothetical protein